ncbi:MAG: hypothetical protein DDG59_06820 [Anaerolineae bacterium]|nr:MAG: hypothetical protein DDG59_06820 [Anaerolineae bacterium]
MRSENSPSFENYSVFDQPSAPDPQAKKRNLRRWIGFFLILSLFLSTASLLQTRKVSTLFGTGSIHGQVITSNGSPFQGEIYILGTSLETKTAPDGTFLMQGVPSGQQVLIVADDQIGRDFPIQVVAGKQLDLGQIRFEATAVPSP